jgi:hypothetical protein
MNGQMPLNDRDFTDIRKSVMRTIESRRTRRAWMLRTAFAIIAILFAIQWPTRTTRVLPPVARGDSRGRAVHLAAPIAQTQVRTRPAVVIASKPSRHHQRRPLNKHHEPTPIRIELATADPDIRIIWITNTNESL